MNELEGKYQSAQESLLELEQDTGMKSSVNERELNRQLEKMTHQYNQQVTVNKTLSSKLMIQEKAYIDEKRAKIDLEKRLNVMMQSRPPSGPGNSDGHDQRNGGGVSDLASMQYSLANVSQRVQHSLQQR